MADWLSDPDALAAQYADASNLNARIALHERYSTADRDLHTWEFDQFDVSDDADVLTLGCGPGRLWETNADRVPDGWNVVVTDFSDGMVERARADLADADHGFAFARVDAATIPFADGSFDAVTANHMLYHVPDREAALREVRRVLRPHGRLYAATNGESNLQGLHEVVESVRGEPHARATAFSLENGREQLEPHFESVDLMPFDDALVVTEVEPLVAYALSRDDFDESLVPALRAAFKARFEDGAFHVGKDVGLFVAARSPTS